MTPKRLHIGVRTRTMYVHPNLRSELPPLDSHQGLGLPRASERANMVSGPQLPASAPDVQADAVGD